MGCSAYPRRVAQARNRDHRADRGQIHATSEQASFTDLANHVKSIVSVDFFTVPTFRFQVLYVFLVLAHDRRRILQFGVTAHPTAEWTVQQVRNAFPWDSAPRYLLRDRESEFFGGTDKTGS